MGYVKRISWIFVYAFKNLGIVKLWTRQPRNYDKL